MTATLHPLAALQAAALTVANEEGVDEVELEWRWTARDGAERELTITVRAEVRHFGLPVDQGEDER